MVALAAAVMGVLGAVAAVAADAQPGDAEAIHRLTHYDLGSAGSQDALGRPDPRVFYSEPDWQDGGLPDRLEASGATLIPADGGYTAIAHGGTLYISSILESGTLVITADELRFTPSTGVAAVSGDVRLELEGTSLRLECDEFFYDPLMEIVEVTGARLSIPLDVLVDEKQLSDDGPRATFGNDFYTPLPENVRVTCGQARLSLDPRSNEFVLSDVTLCHHPAPEPDLFIHADELRLGGDDRITLRGASLQLSGMELLAWPKITRDLKQQKRRYGLEFPIVRFEKDVGVAWKQGVNMDLDVMKLDALLDYSPEYGLLANYYAYTEPGPGIQVGVETGTHSVFDINRVSVERRSDYNLIYSQYIKANNDLLRDALIRVEYGEIVAFTPAQLDDGIPAERQEDTRLFADGWVELPLVPLGGGVYLTTSLIGRYVDYEDTAEHYSAVGAQGGLIWRHGHFDHFLVYRAHRIGGHPVFSFDEVRQREVDFMTSVRIHPDWRHVVRGIYDVEEGEFNQLKVSALKRQRTYEMGFFWDFARESAGLEMGLLVD